MDTRKRKHITGLLYIVVGVILMAWALPLIIQGLIFVVGLILVNNGLQMRGHPSLWVQISRIFFNPFF